MTFFGVDSKRHLRTPVAADDAQVAQPRAEVHDAHGLRRHRPERGVHLGQPGVQVMWDPNSFRTYSVLKGKSQCLFSVQTGGIKIFS